MLSCPKKIFCFPDWSPFPILGRYGSTGSCWNLPRSVFEDTNLAAIQVTSMFESFKNTTMTNDIFGSQPPLVLSLSRLILSTTLSVVVLNCVYSSKKTSWNTLRRRRWKKFWRSTRNSSHTQFNSPSPRKKKRYVKCMHHMWRSIIVFVGSRRWRGRGRGKTVA